MPGPVLSADLDPASDDGVSNTDRITSVVRPVFTVTAGSTLLAGDKVVLVSPQGTPIGSANVTAAEAATGSISIPTGIELDDGHYTFTVRRYSEAGVLLGEAPVQVTIVTDLDGVLPSIELAANGGDFNRDGVLDWRQNNVVHAPIRSGAEFTAGAQAPAEAFGAILVGSVSSAGAGQGGAPAVELDPGAQLSNVKLGDVPAPLPDRVTQSSGLLHFTVSAIEGGALLDVDTAAPGLQVRVVIEVPAGGARANTFLKWNAATQSWFDFLDDQDLATFDEGATLIDHNADGLIDRVVLTLSDGGVGDADGVANGVIVDPGMLALRAATPVYSVLLANGDRAYTTSAAEAAGLAQGAANMFEGVRFDSLDLQDPGARKILANYQPFTHDWYYAAEGGAMPYACYVPVPSSAGFTAAAPGQGAGQDYRLFMNAAGITQLVTAAEAAQLGLAAAGYTDYGLQFRTTATSAFVFDAEGYLIANQGSAAVQAFVQQLAAAYSSSSDAGFIEAVEQHYLAQLVLVGVDHGTSADATQLNAVFGTQFAG